MRIPIRATATAAVAAAAVVTAAIPAFTTTSGQVAFTPDGAQLVVTTKGNGNDIDVFGAASCNPATPASTLSNPDRPSPPAGRYRSLVGRILRGGP